jgi:hypothetical protein
MSTATAKVKLITIICGLELEQRVSTDLKTLDGIGGYTRMVAGGQGTHGARKFGLVDGANVRLEILVAPKYAGQVLELLEANFRDDALIAYVQEVAAIPSKHFLS